MSPRDDAAMEALARGFMLGTGRNPVPLDVALKGLVAAGDAPSELTALALLGQRMRFRKHGPAPESSTPTAIEDSRTIVPEAARTFMRRLVGGKEGSGSDIAALALADFCHRHRLRPHPFDVPRLGAFVKAYGDLLGAYAAAWAERDEVADKRPAHAFDAEAIDETNWTSAAPAARVQFIAALREQEPERARALLEASFASDPASVRLRLVEALACRLSAADIPFLESLAKDRAPSVRDEAERLLKYIPGTVLSEDRLRDLVSRIKVSTAGLLRRRTCLTLESPANFHVGTRTFSINPVRSWAAGEYAGIGLDAIAAALGLSVADMIAGASDDAGLLALIARQATIERRLDVLATIVRDHAADAWTDAIGTGTAADLGGDATIDQWCAAALAPKLWPVLPAAAELESLYRFLRRPLPQSQARDLLHSRAFASAHDGDRPPGTLGRSYIALGALIPSALRADLRAAIAPLPSEETARAVLLLDCLMRLDPSPP